MQAKRSKYNIDTSTIGKTKRTYKDVTYDSEEEMKFYRDWVEPRIESGEIVKVDRQVKYELQPEFEYKDKKFKAIHYKSDFDITFSDGSFKVIDIKGMLKNEDKIKEKLFKYHYPDIDFEFIGKSNIDGGYVPIEKIIQGRKERKKIKKQKEKSN